MLTVIGGVLVAVGTAITTIDGIINKKWWVLIWGLIFLFCIYLFAN